MNYLINLSGQGDQYYFVVGPATWAYIHSPKPSFNDWDAHIVRNSREEQVPQAVIDEMTATKTPGVSCMCNVTSGSWHNDRALHVMEGFTVSHSFPKGRAFEDEYTGCIY